MEQTSGDPCVVSFTCQVSASGIVLHDTDCLAQIVVGRLAIEQAGQGAEPGVLRDRDWLGGGEHPRELANW